ETNLGRWDTFATSLVPLRQNSGTSCLFMCWKEGCYASGIALELGRVARMDAEKCCFCACCSAEGGPRRACPCSSVRLPRAWQCQHRTNFNFCIFRSHFFTFDQ
ncbi:hypothetical protein HAX54_044148, partial [Datura stramonium]|nr:hypothetical protein [Datura stramonium]